MFKPFTFNVSIYVAEFNFEFLLLIFILFVSCLFHIFYIHLYFFLHAKSLQLAQVVKNTPANAEDVRDEDLIPG